MRAPVNITVAILYGFMLFGIATGASYSIWETIRLNREIEHLKTADDFLVVNQLSVPDHNVGDDPIVVYDRSVLEHFRGDWLVEFQQVLDDGSIVDLPDCEGNGSDNYAPNEKASTMRLSQFAGVNCGLSKGRYRVLAIWHMTADDGSKYVQRAPSNVFIVTD